MTQAQLMNSGYARIADDDYKTIEPRCTYGFLEHFKPLGLIVDCCAPNGSGIVDTLKECGCWAMGASDAFADTILTSWIVSNPPYKRPLVDDIINRQIERLWNGTVNGVAMLMRWGFDFAAFRKPMFRDNPYYYGQIKLLFRPRWFEKRKHDKQPFHPYVWHIWNRFPREGRQLPVLMYADGVKP